MKIPDSVYEWFPKLDEKNWYTILGGVLFLVFLLYYFFLMQPRLRDLNVINAKRMTLKQDLQQGRENISKTAFYESEILRLKEQLGKVEYKIPLKGEIPLILQGISSLATRNSIKIDEMVPDKSSKELLLTNKEGKYYSFPILMEARAGYHDIGRFIDGLEKDRIFKSISAMTIAGNVSDPMRHSLKLTIKTIILEKTEEP